MKHSRIKNVNVITVVNQRNSYLDDLILIKKFKYCQYKYVNAKGELK